MTTDLRATLAVADPATHDRYDDAELVRRARAVLADADEVVAPVDLDVVVVVETGTVPARHRARRRTAAVLAVAAVLAAGVLTVPSLIGRTTDTHQKAAAPLDQAAEAIRATDPPARPDQYWQITTTGFVLGASAGDEVSVALVSQDQIAFVAVDGSRPTYVATGPSHVVRQLAGPAPDTLPGDAPGVRELAAPDDSAPSWQSPTAAWLRDLPRDPAALLARVRSDSEGQGNSPDGEVVVTVADVLRSGLVPADLRQALYRVLADVPGVVVSSSDATADGASRVTFAYEEQVDGIRQELVVDSATGVMVGERQVATRALDNIPAGTVIGLSTLSRELVDGIPAEVDAGGRVFHCMTATDGRVTCTG